MRKVTISVSLVLALGFLTVMPGLAAEVTEDAPIDLVQEEPLMTSAEKIESVEDVLDPSQGMQADKIRVCTDVEEQQCPPGCASCVVINNTIHCFC